jgi:phosphoribosylaminoimidazolecarboxamide formyltransferase/IMP cyclohydrolase
MSNTLIKTALISVYNKSGLDRLALKLNSLGVTILSTGGTAEYLKGLDIPIVDVSSVTDFPEIMNGRVKTLHPKIHGGLLGNWDDPEHSAVASTHGIKPIDLVITNLYPFLDVVQDGADFDTCIENIDIGGPTMIRASAKNHKYVTVVTDPQDYDRILDELAELNGSISEKTRRRLAAEAFSLTTTYDSNISSWFTKQQDETDFPRRVSFSGSLKKILRYGENPHQAAALYSDESNRSGVALASQLQGKELSYNNLNDTDAAFELVSEFEEPAVAIIKHANPCGIAVAENTLEAYKRALRCDPVSAFGGIVALNRPLNKETAEAILDTFSEVIIAPSVETDAISVVANKKNLRLLTTGNMPKVSEKRWTVKTIAGGLLVQDYDNGQITKDHLRVVTEREPTEQEIEDLLFAFKVAKHVKSNAIVYAKELATVGIGAGLTCYRQR